MELDLMTWLTDSRILGIVFCAACIWVLRAVAMPDEQREQGRRRGVR